MDVFVHPVALAGWVGLFVTALNLFPVGQLDGGRIAYALFGPWHRQVSIATFVALMVLGAVFRSANWIVFAGLILLLMGFHHPPPLDDLTPALAPPLRPRRLLPHPPDPPDPSRPHQLGWGSGLTFRHFRRVYRVVSRT